MQPLCASERGQYKRDEAGRYIRFGKRVLISHETTQTNDLQALHIMNMKKLEEAR